jgi:hypothetical protein
MFEVRMSNERIITPGGLPIVGELLRRTSLSSDVDNIKGKGMNDPGIKNSDVVITFIGLLCQGKNDFENVNDFREESEFYEHALGVGAIPSEPTFRQRMNLLGKSLEAAVNHANIELLKNANIAPTPCMGKHVSVDIDVSPFNNSDSKKEGVSLTYKQVMGYAPIFAYIGTEGYQLGVELREGKQHCQNGTVEFLAQVLTNAKKITDAPLLVRMDSGNDSADNMAVCFARETEADFIIKRNLRSEDPWDIWFTQATKDEILGKNEVTNPREGKTVYIGSCERYVKTLERNVRIVYRVTLRTSDHNGQMLIESEVTADTWWTSFPAEGADAVSNEDIIKSYCEHGTSEQFHSEIKTDMNLERLPSGRFDTNSAVMLLAMIAYNVLRIIGQVSLNEDDAPLKRPVKRRRLKTVMQNLIIIAVRVVKHARKTYLNLGNSNTWRHTFKRVYETLVR